METNAKTKALRLTLAAVGNPDFGDRDPDLICAPFSVEVADLTDASRLAQAWRECMGLGGGNWIEAQIADRAGRVVGRVSYNGRVWAGHGYSPGAEPLLEAVPLDRGALEALWARITPPHSFEPGPYCAHRFVLDASDAVAERVGSIARAEKAGGRSAR